MRRSYHGHILIILGSGADHGWAANVDILNQMVDRCAFVRSHFLKSIEIHHHHINGGNAVGGDRFHVIGFGANGKNATGYAWMDGLHSAVQHFRKASYFRHIFHWDASVFDGLCGAASGNQFHPKSVQTSCKFHEVRFVCEAQQSPPDFCHETVIFS